jgi:hypothetical protein
VIELHEDDAWRALPEKKKENVEEGCGRTGLRGKAWMAALWRRSIEMADAVKSSKHSQLTDLPCLLS